MDEETKKFVLLTREDPYSVLQGYFHERATTVLFQKLIYGKEIEP